MSGAFLRGMMLAGLTFFSGQLAAQPRDKVIMSWLPATSTIAFFVALEEKMFEAAGIDVDHSRFDNPNQLIEGMIAGRSEVGPGSAAAGAVIVSDARFPGAIKIVGFQGSYTEKGFRNDGLIVKPDSPIKGFADLKGKRLAVLPGIQWRTISRYIVRKNGLNPDTDVTIVEMALGLHAQAVAAGTVDAAITIEPVASIVEASGSVKKILINPAGMAIGEPFFPGLSIMTTKFIKERPEVARRVLAVLDAATKKAQADFNKYKPLLTKYTSATPETLAYLQPSYLRSVNDITPAELASFARYAQIFVSEGVLDKPLDVKTLVLDPKTLR